MKILNGECPQSLTEKEYFPWTWHQLLVQNTEANLKRLEVILEELQNIDDIIIFIDEIHTIIGVVILQVL